MKAEFNPKNYTIIFFGTPQFSVPSLSHLYKAGYNIAAVITQPDKAQGRGRQLSPSPVKAYAQKLGLEVWQPLKFDQQIINKLKSLKADLFVVVAYGKFLSATIINLAKLDTVNIHPSLLPKYRGPSPIQATLLNGDSKTGNSLMLIDKDMDHGPLLAQSEVDIDDQDNTESLSQKLSLDAAQLLIKALPDYIKGKVQPEEQNHQQATYSKLITKDDGLIDWEDKPNNILNKIRAYNPWPVVQINWQNKVLKIYQARISDKNLSPGKIDIDKANNKIYIGTAAQALEILELQLPGKKRLKAKDFINGLK